MVLKNPTINYAVLETARGGILRSGLGFDRCDIAVVTNVAADHLGLAGVDTLAELARVKAVVPQSVFRDGEVVLNADNQWTAIWRGSARGEIIFFSMDEDNPVVREHLRDRGRAVVLRQTRARRDDHDHRAPPRNEPAARQRNSGDVRRAKLRVNVANAMAASAAALADDVQLEYIRQAMRTFTTSFFQTPGRFNVLEFEGRRVIMDYCHNVAGLESMADFVGRMENPRKLAVISMPGDRLDDDIKAFGRLAGATFDELIMREDTNRRGRQNGEIARLLRESAIEGGLADEAVHVVLDEFDAVRKGVERTAKDRAHRVDDRQTSSGLGRTRKNRRPPTRLKFWRGASAFSSFCAEPKDLFRSNLRTPFPARTGEGWSGALAEGNLL